MKVTITVIITPHNRAYIVKYRTGTKGKTNFMTFKFTINDSSFTRRGFCMAFDIPHSAYDQEKGWSKVESRINVSKGDLLNDLAL